MAITKLKRPKKICAGIIVRRIDSFSFGYKNATNPTTYCIINITTADNPIQEWSEYIFGIGFSAKLCESNTAIRAITVQKKARACIVACEILSDLFRCCRNPRYRRIAKFGICHKILQNLSIYVLFLYLQFPKRIIIPNVIINGCQLNCMDGLLFHDTPPKWIPTQQTTNVKITTLSTCVIR